MANKAISELTSATTPLAGTELMEIVQDGANKKVAVSALGGGGGSALIVANRARVECVNSTALVLTIPENSIDSTGALRFTVVVSAELFATINSQISFTHPVIGTLLAGNLEFTNGANQDSALVQIEILLTADRLCIIKDHSLVQGGGSGSVGSLLLQTAMLTALGIDWTEENAFTLTLDGGGDSGLFRNFVNVEGLPST